MEDVESIDAPAVFSELFKGAVGALMFAEEPRYYVLDGQHRVSAIKLLVEGAASRTCADGFLDEVLSVIVVLPEDHSGGGRTWRQRYRRLFTSLNRWCEPTDRDTNIIMDEDDRFAVLTRRLMTEHEFFRAEGKQRDSYRMATKGRNLRSGAAQFTTLQVLYDMNRRLLSGAARLQDGWPPPGRQRDPFLQRRPSEDELKRNLDELCACWDALIRLLPELLEDPRTMRQHDVRGADSLLFWPVGQLMFAELVRELLNRGGHGESRRGGVELDETLGPLAGLRWDLHELPWRHVLLTGPHADGARWRMRSEDRKKAVEFLKRLTLWLLDGEASHAAEDLRTDWLDLLYPPLDDAEAARSWREILALRSGEIPE